MDLLAAIERSRSINDLQGILFGPGNNFKALPITSWRGRYLHVPGYNGQIEIDQLVLRVLMIARERNFNFNLSERSAGKKIALNIDKLYVCGGDFLRNSHFTIRFLSVIREICIMVFGSCFFPKKKTLLLIRNEWLNGFDGMASCNQLFSFYTIAQHRAAFGVIPHTEDYYANYTNYFSGTIVDNGHLPILIYNRLEAVL